MNIITVVLGADTKDRTKDSVQLIEYAYKNYEIYNLEKMIQENTQNGKKINESRIEVIKGKKNNLTTILQEVDNTYYPIKKIDKDNINIKIYNIKKFLLLCIKMHI